MKREIINSRYVAVEKLVKLIEAEKEEPNEKNEYEIYLERAEEAARKAEAAARKAEIAAQEVEAAAWKMAKGFKKGKGRMDKMKTSIHLKANRIEHLRRGRY